MSREDEGKSSLPGRFVQLPNVLYPGNPKLTPKERDVYGAIVARLVGKNVAYPSEARIGKDIGMSARRVSPAITSLERKGYLTVERAYRKRNRYYPQVFVRGGVVVDLRRQSTTENGTQSRELLIDERTTTKNGSGLVSTDPSIPLGSLEADEEPMTKTVVVSNPNTALLVQAADAVAISRPALERRLAELDKSASLETATDAQLEAVGNSLGPIEWKAA